MAERVQHPVTKRMPQGQTILNRRREMDPGIDPALSRLGRRICKAIELARNPGQGGARGREGLFAEEVGQNCGRGGAEGGMPGDIVGMVRGREKRNNRVLEAASILVDRRSRRAKTDRLDAAALLRTLMALERGEPRVCRVVRVPSPEHEDTRRRSRERARLVNERTQHTSRIKGLLMTQGIRDFAPTRRDWRERLDRLRTADGHALLLCLKAEIARECRRLWQVIDMIAEVEAEQQVAAETTTGASQLSRLRGIGLTIASVLTNEVFFRTFQNRREIAGYLGLASSPWNSGSVSRDQGIQRSGNPRARQTAIELAWLWLRHQPESGLARWFHERVGASKGRIRRTMIVALARKLMIALWRYVTQGLMPEGAVIKA